MSRVSWSVCVLMMFAMASRAGARPSPSIDARWFLMQYTEKYAKLRYAESLAEWESNTRIIEGDSANAARTRKAAEATAAFTGSVKTIEKCRELLAKKEQIPPLLVKQLNRVLYMAANNPQTVAETVRERIALETDQSEKLFGFSYVLNGKEVSTNEIDEILRTETDLSKRLEAWKTSKKVGIALRTGLVNLRRLRNETVRALGYDDFFSYQVSDYGMTTAEMMELNRRMNRELRPLYTELHTYFRHELARKYGQPVPDLIPAHWLPNRWGQDWTALVKVEGLDLNAALEKKGAEWLVKQAERFYVSLGFSALPASFYEKSSLYPLSPETGYKKNNHASAWHLDLDKDVRSLMSVETNADWYATTHHELGHIYYYISYTNPDVPLLLRGGANRAFHEGIGSLMGLAAMQPRFLSAVGLAPSGATPDAIQMLLKEALDFVVFVPWSAGVMTEFEHDLYAGELPTDQWNDRWWALKRRFQGIVPPSPRGGDLCDPATKTHINNDAAQYYDYALSNLLLFQLHDHIARKILKEDPRNTNYFGRKDVGRFLADILRRGATADWRELIRESTGKDLSATTMLNYFEPLSRWLKEQNKGRKHTLPAL